jgi:hypothetical protein
MLTQGDNRNDNDNDDDHDNNLQLWVPNFPYFIKNILQNSWLHYPLKETVTIK